ncbi:MAG: peptidoglycan DD-metalloendopeptidase family protein [Firmicutes bacterium]|nr:peptidoglycan DD-metalloendopeptidase family protein [Bacillota bacterium]
MRSNRKNKSIACFLVMAVVFTYCFMPVLTLIRGEGGSAAFAQTYEEQIKEKEGEVEQIDDEREEIKNELSQVADEIKELQASVDQTNAQISQTTQDIKATEGRIEDKKEEIKQKKKEIKKKQKEIQKREEGLNERLVVMYKNGSVGFIDVLMGSNSISEFVSNVEMIQKIYENDVDVLKLLEKEHKKLEKERKKLQEEEQELQAIQAELAQKKETLKAQVEQLNAQQTKLDEKKKYLLKKDDELKAQADALIDQIKKLQDASRVYEGGAFNWPVPSSTYISSSFGGRIHPVYRTWRVHTGTDIAASYGADIVAAASGKVIMATWYGGYGNCVMIDHGTKDGASIVTLYGHCSSLCVSLGQEVQRGQLIARVGSTGTSTGNHCHFEVRINGQYVDPMGYFS